MHRFTAAAVAASLCALAAPADARPITSGEFRMVTLDGGLFSVQGPGFAVTGSTNDSANVVFPLLAGAVFQPWVQGSGLGVGGGPGTVDGVTYPRISWSIWRASDVRLDGAPIVITGPGSYSTTFTTTSFSLCGFEPNDPPPTPFPFCKVDLRDLTGSGVYEFSVIAIPGSDVLQTMRGVWRFTVPEPATLALLALGLVGAGASRLRAVRRGSALEAVGVDRDRG